MANQKVNNYKSLVQKIQELKEKESSLAFQVKKDIGDLKDELRPGRILVNTITDWIQPFISKETKPVHSIIQQFDFAESISSTLNAEIKKRANLWIQLAFAKLDKIIAVKDEPDGVK